MRFMVIVKTTPESEKEGASGRNLASPIILPTRTFSQG
jgi:hypothetical protein